MIDDLTLKKILKENNLTLSSRIRKDLINNINYEDFIEVLSILKKLNISPTIVEKNLSILYTNGDNIRNNYRLLKYNGLFNYTQEELLNILSKNYKEVKENYDYLLKKYSNEDLNKNIKILSVPIQRIKRMQKYEQVLSKEALLYATTSKYSDDELHEIIVTCNRYNATITPNIFNRNSDEIKNIIKLTHELGIKLTDSVYTKTPKELEKIFNLFKDMKLPFYNELLYCKMDKIETLLSSFLNKGENKTLIYFHNDDEKRIKEILEICNKYNLNVDYETLYIDPNQVLKIVELCNNYNVKITEKMLTRNIKDIEEIIKYCKDKDLIIRDTYFERTKREIEEIHDKCNMKLKRDDLTYKRNIKEILDILIYCEVNHLTPTNIMFNNNVQEIEKIVQTCKKRHIEVSNGVFKTNHENLDKIITILKQQPLVVPFTPLACNRTPYEVRRIKEIVRKYNVRLIPEMFLRTPYEVEKIIELSNKKIEDNYFRYPLEKFEEILNFCNKEKIKISPSMLDRTTYEIEDILQLCNDKKIEIIDVIYQRTEEEIQEIIKYCEEKKLEISSDCFRKNPEQFKEAVESCEKLNIPAVGEVFKRTPEEIKEITKIYEKLLKQDPINNSFGTTPQEVEKIINLLLKNKIEIQGVVFRKKADELEETIEFIKEKYGEEFALPQVIIYDKNHIEKIFSYCSGRGALEIIKVSPYILKLSLEEIVDRDVYINCIGGNFVEDGKFNKVFLLSKKKYQELKEIEKEKGKVI